MSSWFAGMRVDTMVINLEGKVGTPRPRDQDPSPGYRRCKLGPDLEAVQVPDGHVSIRPAGDPDNSKLNPWAATRGQDPPSPLTSAVKDAIVGEGKRPKT